MAKSKAINQEQERSAAREAVRTLIRWAGDDPDRPGMEATPDHVLSFYQDFFTGYRARPEDYAASTAQGLAYDDFILVRDIALMSFCEHHLLPATGTAHIAYIPGPERVPGIGAIARLATDCAARFTTQESVTERIASMLEQAFSLKGAAIAVTLSHGCMTLRQAGQQNAAVTTTRFTGSFIDNLALQRHFLTLSAGADRQE